MNRLLSEDVLVERLKERFSTRRRDVLLGIGDDAALVRVGAETAALSTDVLVAGEDFLPGTDPFRLGRKAINVNLSDLAAMGVTPLHALLTLGLPRGTDPVWLDLLLDGVKSAATDFGLAVVGGDLSASETLFISVSVVGRPGKKGALPRSGAKAGDLLFVSGTLGAAAAGLKLLQAGYRLLPDGGVRSPAGRRLTAARAPDVGRLIRHQLNPRPMVELGRALADGALATAAIDVSDGLARDLHRLCRASAAGASVDLGALPVDSALPSVAKELASDPLSLALHGGEDFGLLFTVPPHKVASVERLASRFALRRIGIVDNTSLVRVNRNNQSTPLPDAGFDHFASPGKR